MPFVVVVFLVSGMLAVIVRSWTCVLVGGVLIAYFLYFFRDPERTPPRENDVIVAGADGTVASVTDVHEGTYLNADCVRISIFLSLFDVHVNRAPIAGQATFLGYFPGRRLLAFRNKSSEVNQNNKILIVGAHTRCLVCQIVGAFVRRVVYWLPHDKPADVALGQRIGMMKFGSRLDMYFPKADVDVLVRPGTKVQAGIRVVARVKEKALDSHD